MQPRNMLSRRDLLKAAAGMVAWTGLAQAAAEGVGPMKITKVEAVRFRPDLRLVPGIEPNWMWVRLHTDKGIVGLGESYPGYGAHGAGKAGRISARPGYQGDQDLSLRPGSCQRLRQTRRHVHHPVGVEEVSRSDRADPKSGGR